MAKVLIGFMGAGKSSVARLLDEDFIDMDEVIVDKIGMPISDFFESEGEVAFRRIESETLQELLTSDHLISTGGGVVVSPENRQLLAENDQTIFLKAEFETLYDRIAQDKDNVRPLFNQNTKEAFKAIYDERQPLYKEAASHTVSVDHKSPEEIAEMIACL